MEIRHATHPDEMDSLDGAGLRARFLVDGLFAPGEARLAYSMSDRIVLGGVMPTGSDEIALRPPPALRSDEFCDRREIGIACLAGSGDVRAGNERYPMAEEEVVYLGKGTGPITFRGDGAAFYFVSAAAHDSHPPILARRGDAEAIAVGDPGHANARTIRKYIHPGGIRSCQLTLGITTLDAGSVWNTLPCHTHERRSETYLYFGLETGERILHLCGRPESTRSIVVADRQAVLSPPWSVHLGAGTASYRFVWATAGENQSWDDTDPVATDELR